MINPNKTIKRIKTFSERLDAGIKAKDASLITAKHLDDWIFENVDDIINPISKEFQK